MAQAEVQLSLKVQRPKDLLALWYPNGRHGGLTLEGSLPGELGTPCALQVEFLEPASRKFRVRGRLAWARHKGSRDLRECFGVDFLDEDMAGRERLLRYAREELDSGTTRFEERLSTNLAVKLTHAGKSRKEKLADLSQGGAFVRTTQPLAVGTELELEVRPPLSLSTVKLRGRVAWVRNAPPQGMGIEFLYDDPRQSQRVRDLLDKLAG